MSRILSKYSNIDMNIRERWIWLLEISFVHFFEVYPTSKDDIGHDLFLSVVPRTRFLRSTSTTGIMLNLIAFWLLMRNFELFSLLLPDKLNAQTDVGDLRNISLKVPIVTDLLVPYEADKDMKATLLSFSEVMIL